MNNTFLANLISQYNENVNDILVVLVYDRRDFYIIEEISTIDLNESQIDINYNVIRKMVIDVDTEVGEGNDFLIITQISEKKLVLCSLGSNFILTTIAEKDTSEIELKLYSIHIAGEIERYIEEAGLEDLSLKIPGIIKVYSKVKNIKTSIAKLSLKIIVIGQHKAGKSALINRFIEKEFKTDLNATVGFRVYKKLLNIDDKLIMNLAIWDTGVFSYPSQSVL